MSAPPVRGPGSSDDGGAEAGGGLGGDELLLGCQWCGAPSAPVPPPKPSPAGPIGQLPGKRRPPARRHVPSMTPNSPNTGSTDYPSEHSSAPLYDEGTSFGSCPAIVQKLMETKSIFNGLRPGEGGQGTHSSPHTPLSRANSSPYFIDEVRFDTYIVGRQNFFVHWKCVCEKGYFNGAILTRCFIFFRQLLRHRNFVWSLLFYHTCTFDSFVLLHTLRIGTKQQSV